MDAHTAFKALISTSPYPACALGEQLAIEPLVEIVFKADFGGGGVGNQINQNTSIGVNALG